MNVKELIEILNEYDPELLVVAACEGYGHALRLDRRDICIEGYAETYGDKLQAVLSIVAKRS